MDILIKFLNFDENFSIDDVNYADVTIENHSLLHWVAAQGSVSALIFLLNNGCDMLKKTATGYTILHEACAFGNIKTVEFIISQKYDLIFEESYDGNNILHESYKYNQSDVINYLYTFHKKEFLLLKKKNNLGKFPLDCVSNIMIKEKLTKY